MRGSVSALDDVHRIGADRKVSGASVDVLIVLVEGAVA
jgi:hypothetical protein